MISNELGGRYYRLGLREEYVRVLFCQMGNNFLGGFLRRLAVPKVNFSLMTGLFVAEDDLLGLQGRKVSEISRVWSDILNLGVYEYTYTYPLPPPFLERGDS